MNKKYIPLLPVAAVIFCCQNVYAHNDNNIQKNETERKVAAEQEASDDWDDFMSQVKSQEKDSNDEAEKHQAELPD